MPTELGQLASSKSCFQYQLLRLYRVTYFRTKANVFDRPLQGVDNILSVISRSAKQTGRKSLVN